MILIYIIDGDFLDIDLFFNQDKKIKIDMRINYFLRKSIFVTVHGKTYLNAYPLERKFFFVRGNSLVNLNLHHFLAGREDNISRY